MILVDMGTEEAEQEARNSDCPSKKNATHSWGAHGVNARRPEFRIARLISGQNMMTVKLK